MEDAGYNLIGLFGVSVGAHVTYLLATMLDSSALATLPSDFSIVDLHVAGSRAILGQMEKTTAAYYLT